MNSCLLDIDTGGCTQKYLYCTYSLPSLSAGFLSADLTDYRSEQHFQLEVGINNEETDCMHHSTPFRRRDFSIHRCWCSWGFLESIPPRYYVYIQMTLPCQLGWPRANNTKVAMNRSSAQILIFNAILQHEETSFL